jgi:hypothetical protein
MQRGRLHGAWESRDRFSVLVSFCEPARRAFRSAVSITIDAGSSPDFDG